MGWASPILLTISFVLFAVSLLALNLMLYSWEDSDLGAFLFTREYGLRFSFPRLLGMAITYIPYQWLLGISAVRAVSRELRSQHNWEKTTHLGAHRRDEPLSSITWRGIASSRREQ